jgi:hypothetical protein
MIARCLSRFAAASIRCGIGSGHRAAALSARSGNEDYDSCCRGDDGSCHLLLTPLRDAEGNLYSLIEILQGIKSASAHSLNRVLGREGPVWQEGLLIM